MNEEDITTINYDRRVSLNVRDFYNPTYDNQNTYNPYFEVSESILQDKLLKEINHRTNQLEEQLDIVNNKNNQQFIKGRLFELSEFRNNLLNNYWTHERERQSGINSPFDMPF